MPIQEITTITDTAAILDVMAYKGGEKVEVHITKYGSWFWKMAQDSCLDWAELKSQFTIDFINVAMAIGLPGSEDQGAIDSCPGKIDVWAKRLDQYTNIHGTQYSTDPVKVDKEAGYFFMSMLVKFVQEELRFRGGPICLDDSDATDSRFFSVHGILSDDFYCYEATLTTLPVLYVALGKKLGYPVYLVPAKGGYFVRWENADGDYFNIDATARVFKPFDDKHFRNWPQPMSDREARSGFYFGNLSTRGYFIHFLFDRIRCLIDNLRMGEALQSCWLLARFAGGSHNPMVRDRWASVTVMARVLEQARKDAGAEDYASLDLRKVSIPENINYFEKVGVPMAHIDLDRLATLRKRPIHRARNIEDMNHFTTSLVSTHTNY